MKATACRGTVPSPMLFTSLRIKAVLGLLCRYGRKALQEMYQVYLRRRSPNALATPAWMADILVDMAPEDLEKRRAQLFEVRPAISRRPEALSTSRHREGCEQAYAPFCSQRRRNDSEKINEKFPPSLLLFMSGAEVHPSSKGGARAGGCHQPGCQIWPRGRLQIGQ